jgi:hypothetical protein
MKAFGRRVDAHLKQRKAALRAASAKHPLSAGRKEKLKERARRRKAKGRGDDGLGEVQGAEDDEEVAASGASLPAAAGSKRAREATTASDGGDGAEAVAPVPAKRRPLRTDEFPTDRVAFGDRALQPPTLAVIPRSKVRVSQRKCPMMTLKGH